MAARQLATILLQGLLVVFKRDKTGRIFGLSVAPDALHELPFRKTEVN